MKSSSDNNTSSKSASSLPAAIDTQEMGQLLNILEQYEEHSPKAAQELLKDFTQKHKELCQIIANSSSDLKHEDWKRECDRIKKTLDTTIQKIYDLDL